MNPDVSTTFQIVNASPNDLVVGTNPPAGIVAWNQYQMAQWFNYPNRPSPLCAVASVAEGYVAQFLRGVGDEDDAADMLISAGSETDAGSTLFALQARTDSHSGHYLQVTLCPGSGIQNHLLGIVAEGTFENAGPAGVQWHALGDANAAQISLGYGNNGTQALILADLAALYDTAQAEQIYNEVLAGTLTQGAGEDLYGQVAGLCFASLTTLSYSLLDLTFDNPQPPTPGAREFIGETTVNLEAGSLTQTFNVHTETVTEVQLTSAQAWGVGVDVSFDLPLPFVEGSISGSFDYSSEEFSSVSEETAFDMTVEITLDEPGSYVITKSVVMAQNYPANFAATLQIQGTVLAGPSRVPLNAAVLLAIMGNDARNNGYAAGALTAGQNCVTAPVQGSMNATFGYDVDISVTTPAGVPVTPANVDTSQAKLTPAAGGTATAA